jgi:hypothetical protein
MPAGTALPPCESRRFITPKHLGYRKCLSRKPAARFCLLSDQDEKGFAVTWEIGKGSCFALAWLALCWPALALSQNAASPQDPDASILPDAPSVSASQANGRLLAQNWTSQAQSRWLVSLVGAPYHPLSPREKFQSFVHHTFSPYTFAGAAYDATWAQIWGHPYEYGGGTEGWGKRLGAAVAATESRSFFGSFLFPTLLRQDPRYFAVYHGPVVKRGFHALSRVFVTRSDDGSNTFNTSGMLAIAFSESLSMAWMPDGKRGAGTALNCMVGAIQGDATSYVLREFAPDFLRIFKRHAPKSLRRIELRLPSKVTGDSSQP